MPVGGKVVSIKARSVPTVVELSFPILSPVSLCEFELLFSPVFFLCFSRVSGINTAAHCFMPRSQRWVKEAASIVFVAFVTVLGRFLVLLFEFCCFQLSLVLLGFVSCSILCHLNFSSPRVTGK